MFWYIYLAHFLADYPLQPDWLVVAKREWKGLLVHVGIHFVTMSVITWPYRSTLWPYLLALTVIHFGIDAWKNFLANVRPEWVASSYILDQFLHLLSVLWITRWITGAVPAPFLPPESSWPIYVTGFLLATYVTYISERLLAYANGAYRQEIVANFWSRMLIRAGLVAILVGGWELRIGAVIQAGLVGRFPYFSGTYRQRALLIDIFVALIVSLLIVLARS